MNTDHAFEYQQLINNQTPGIKKIFFFLNQIERIQILIIKNPENKKLHLGIINHSTNSNQKFFIYVEDTCFN